MLDKAPELFDVVVANPADFKDIGLFFGWEGLEVGNRSLDACLIRFRFCSFGSAALDFLLLLLDMLGKMLGYLTKNWMIRGLRS